MKQQTKRNQPRRAARQQSVKRLDPSAAKVNKRKAKDGGKRAADKRAADKRAADKKAADKKGGKHKRRKKFMNQIKQYVAGIEHMSIGGGGEALPAGPKGGKPPRKPRARSRDTKYMDDDFFDEPQDELRRGDRWIPKRDQRTAPTQPFDAVNAELWAAFCHLDAYICAEAAAATEEGPAAVPEPRADAEKPLPVRTHLPQPADKPRTVPVILWVSYCALEEWIYRQSLTPAQVLQLPLQDDVLDYQTGHGVAQPVTPPGFTWTADRSLVPVDADESLIPADADESLIPVDGDWSLIPFDAAAYGSEIADGRAVSRRG